jgi:conjugative transfer signal peptidase TraF
MRIKLLGVVVLVVATYFAVARWSARPLLVFNVTPSMPIGMYTVAPLTQPLRFRDTIGVCLSGPFATIALDRTYATQGTCPRGGVGLLKEVGGVGGEVIVQSKAGITIDGHPLPLTPALPRDAHAKPLSPFHLGSYRLRKGEIFLYTPCARGWDSRYFGPVPARAVIAYVRPLLLLPDFGYRNRTCNVTGAMR